MANAVPIFEPYRKLGVLWTKCLGYMQDADGNLIIKHGKPLTNPSHQRRIHCLNIGKGIFIHTDGNQIAMKYTNDLNSLEHLPYEMTPCEQHRLVGFEQGRLNDELTKWEFYQEKSTEFYWKAILQDIFSICSGVARKFSKQSTDVLHDLANETVCQVASKIIRGKLVYTPGRAPVFNLITTTVHRCIFSTLSKDQRWRNNLQRHAEYCSANQDNNIRKETQERGQFR